MHAVREGRRRTSSGPPQVQYCTFTSTFKGTWNLPGSTGHWIPRKGLSVWSVDWYLERGLNGRLKNCTFGLRWRLILLLEWPCLCVGPWRNFSRTDTSMWVKRPFRARRAPRILVFYIAPGLHEKIWMEEIAWCSTKLPDAVVLLGTFPKEGLWDNVDINQMAARGLRILSIMFLCSNCVALLNK